MSLTSDQKATLYQNIGNKLKQVREAMNLDLEEAAHLQGILPERLMGLECGSMTKLSNRSLGSLVYMMERYNQALVIDGEPYVPNVTYRLSREELLELLSQKEG